MNWKLIVQLSMFGLIMAFGTISLIPEKFEFLFWIVIFIVVAYIIDKVCNGKYFLHGFMVSVFNCVYITAAHTIFYTSYNAHHPDMTQVTFYMSPHLVLSMLIIGIGSAIVFGLIQGLVAFITSKIVKPNVPVN